MPARFFFDLCSGAEIIRDEVGVEAEDLGQALAVAQSVVAEMAEEVTEADPNRRWTLMVRDRAGSVLGLLPIKR